MNILFVDQFPSIGGGQRSLLELLPLVARRGWKARVALPEEGALAEKVRAAGFATDMVPCGSYAPGRKTLTDFGRYLFEIRPMVKALDALTARHRIGLLYVTGPRLLPAAAWVARARSIPLLFHSHHRILQPVAARLAGQSLHWSRASVLACCRFAGEPLRRYAGKRLQVIYNGVPAPRWIRRARDPVQPWTIGVVGRVEPEKGQLQFVEAARILSAAYPCRFVVAGAPLFSGPDYFLRVKEAARGLPVDFLGWQTEISTTFSRLDLLVVPSSDIDSTPRVVLEAFAGGIPVVAFASGGIPEIVEDGRTGFLAAPGSAGALAARMAAVLRMGLAPLRMVTDEARCEWRTRFTLERFQSEVGDAIQRAA